MRRLLTVMVALLLALTGCSATSGSDAGAEPSGGYVGHERAAGEDGTATDDAAAGEESTADLDEGGLGGEASGDGESARQVITTGYVSMTVEDPRQAARESARLVEHVGGWVEQRSETSADGDLDASALLVVRIPATEVTTTLERLEELGEVQQISQSSDDVTAQSQDLDARIRALRTSISRLEALLERSGSVEEIVEAEQVLTDRQSQLESLESQRSRLSEQVAMSTFELDLWSTPPSAIEARGGFLGGLSTGWDSLVSTLAGLSLALGVLLPWLILLGLVALVAVAVRRRLGRRQTATAPSAAPSSPPEEPSSTQP
ncbi:DUF4349 domain-containing protein [Actinotalea sp. BY-33]|uniref:DUF4349 domain-containing protein n=1 Tax=Actinotalea soli TaxID=2819234 RepID=A0A939RVK1_9CELL|nr:DUF4349 domain-containing protein [Actinotalea soli]MBO1751703.1 DUF4349 domain-containing protein [Actinotalea soli]